MLMQLYMMNQRIILEILHNVENVVKRFFENLNNITDVVLYYEKL